MLDLGMIIRSPQSHHDRFPISPPCHHPHHHLQGKEDAFVQILVTTRLLELKGSIASIGIAETAASLHWLRTPTPQFNRKLRLRETRLKNSRRGFFNIFKRGEK